MNKQNRYPKLCIITPLPPPYGGMAIQATRLISSLRLDEIEVEILKTNQEFPQGFKWLATIPCVRTLVRLILFLYEAIRKLRLVDIVYIISSSYLFFFVHTAPLIIAARLLGKNVFVSYRGGLAEEFLKKYQPIPQSILRLATGITVPSDFLKNIFLKFGLQSTIVPNIAEMTLFSFKKRYPVRPRLIVTRHLEKIYNVECIIKAFKIIKQRFPEATLGIVGDGSQRDYLEQMASQLEENGIKFYGSVSQQKLSKIYNEYDILVNASNADNFPSSIIEGFSSGLPVVTTKAGGIPYVVEDGKTGLLVESNDYKAMAERIIQLIENPSLAADIAENARKESEKYTWKNVKARLFEVLFNH